MAFIDTTFVNRMLGAAVVSELTNADSSELAEFIALAEGVTNGYLQAAGYSLRSSSSQPATTPSAVKLACLGSFVRLLFGAKGYDLPREQFGVYLTMEKQLRLGEIELPDEPTRDTTRAVGGVEFSLSDENKINDGAVFQVFSRKKMQGF